MQGWKFWEKGVINTPSKKNIDRVSRTMISIRKQIIDIFKLALPVTAKVPEQKLLLEYVVWSVFTEFDLNSILSI